MITRIWVVAATVVATTVVAAAALDGCGTNHVSGEVRQSRPGFPAAATFPADTGRPLREPAELRSHHGVLRATLPVEEKVVEVAGARVRGKVYGGSFPGPTLRVRPGDKLALRVVNRMGEPTNLHEHGFHVSPIGISDNVLRTMPGSTANRVRVRIPRDIAPGTYWYHAHLHGLVEEQVFSGLAGIIIVEGLDRRLPRALRDVPDHLLALKDLQVRDGAIIDHEHQLRRADDTHRQRTGRPGARRAHEPHAATAPREHQRGHLVPARTRRRPLPGHRRGRQPGRPRVARAAARATARQALRRPGPLAAARYVPAADATDEHRAGRGHVPGRSARHDPRRRPSASAVTWPRSLGALPRLGRAHVDRVRHVTFSENKAGSRYFINGRQFDATRVSEVVRLGATEEWVIRNTSKEQHPFHLHVDDFQVISVNGRPYHARGLQDTVPLPVGGTVRVRMRFRDYVGAFVFHCHILAHEDAGMMAIVDVNRNGRRPSTRTLRALAAMRDAMSADHQHAHP